MDEVFGRYRLREKIGAGGMGQVYRAYDTVTERFVAVKVLPGHLSADPGYRERFRREAHAAARLREPHIVPIHDYGDIDGRLFLDMRLVDGEDLKTVLDREGPLPPQVAVDLVEQIAAALDAAHAEGLVHRDVKPANILLTERAFAYLIDFGIARSTADTGLTSTGVAVGTVAYMAPERLSEGRADRRADVYALACVLYECLTGTRPFEGESLEQQLAAHLTAPPPRPSASRPPLRPFDEVIARGMDKDPDRRHSTAGEFADAARGALGGIGSAAQPASVPAARPDGGRGAPRYSRTATTVAAPVAAGAALPDQERADAVPAGAGSREAPTIARATDPARQHSSAVELVLVCAALVVAAVVAVVVVTTSESDAKPGAVVTGSIPLAGSADAVAVDPAADRLYVSSASAKVVSIVDTNTRSVVGTVPVGGEPGPLAFDPITHHLFVADGQSNSVSVIDPAAQAVLATVPVGFDPTDMVSDPSTGILYVVSRSEVSVVDARSRTVTATIPCDSARQAAIDPAAHTLYVSAGEGLTVIDTRAGAVATTIALDDHDYAGSLDVALDPMTHTVYATQLTDTDGGDERYLSVVAGDRRQVLASVPVHGNALDLAVDPDSNTAYVVHYNDVEVIDTESRTVATTVELGFDGTAVDIAIDSAGDTAYIAQGGGNEVTVISR